MHSQHYVKHSYKELSLCHKNIFLIPLYLQPNFVDIDNFDYEFCSIKENKLEISEVYTIRLQRFRNQNI